MTSVTGKIFQFFNYKTDKNPRVLLRSINDSGAVPVFDLEDSKYIPFDAPATERLKEESRNIILDKLKFTFPEKVITGIRINNSLSAEYGKDIKLLSDLKDVHEFAYLFFPKTENVLSLKKLIQDFDSSGARLPEIIPIIETRKGADNLQSIAGFCRLNGIRMIAFGHSDYNLDTGIFPFIHPGSPAFIRLVKPYIEIIESEGLEYVNTPFLDLSDMSLFKRVLGDVANVCRNRFSQVTLSRAQTECSRNYSEQTTSFDYKPENVNSDMDRMVFAENLINEYELRINGSAGIVINDKGRILTPQEYEGARKFLCRGASAYKPDEPGFTVCILGGCLPVQEKIDSEELYHGILRQRGKEKYGLNTEIICERYDALASVPGILENTAAVNHPDCLIFHVRPDPFLLNIKLFAKYLNRGNVIKHRLNIHLFGFKECRPFPVNAGRTKRKANSFSIYLRQTLRFLNYLAGFISGNYSLVSNEYSKLIFNIKQFCTDKNIGLIVTGPPARPRSNMEMILLKKLGKKMKKEFSGNTCYVDFFHFVDKENNSLFMDDMIHYNTKGHQLFAELLTGPFLAIAGRNDRNPL